MSETERSDGNTPRRAEWSWWFAIGALLVCHFAWLMHSFVPAITHPDANGYWAQGSLLAETGRTWFEPANGVQYVGMHWLLTPAGHYVCRYSPGLSVLVAAVYKTCGAAASLLINPALATLSLLGLFLIIRQTAGPGWGVLGAVVLAINPQFNEHALTAIAHMPVGFLLTWGVCFLVSWSARPRWWKIFLAGLFLGAIPAVRYPEAIFALGLGIFLLCHVKEKKIWQHYGAAVAGALIPLVPLLIRNHRIFGAFYKTGYALTNEQTGFGWNYFQGHYLEYIKNLNADALGLFFALAVIGLVAMCSEREQRRLGLLLILLIVPSTLLYMAYYWSGMRGMSLRFLMPTLFCYVIAGIHALVWMTRLSPRAMRMALLTALLTMQAVWSIPQSRDKVQTNRQQKEILNRVTEAVEQEIRHGDPVIADGGILQHLDFVRHWPLIEASALRPGGNMAGRRPMPMGQDREDDIPRPMQREKREQRRAQYEGLSPRERDLAIAEDIRAWAPGHAVYYVGRKADLEALPGRMFGTDNFSVVARIPLPERPQRADRPGRPGMAGMPGGMGRPGPGGPDGLDWPTRARQPNRQRGGMGMFSAGRYAGEKELVIARWTPPA